MADVTAEALKAWGEIKPNSELAPLAVGLRLMRGGRLIERVIDRLAGLSGLTVAGDYEVLAALRRKYPDPVQPAVLSELTMVSTSAITGRLDRLEADGLIVRRPNPTDRRAVDILITAAGRHLAEAAFEGVSNELAVIFGPIDSDELMHTADHLRSVLELLE